MLTHGMKQGNNSIQPGSSDAQRLLRELRLLESELAKYRKESRKSRQQMEEMREDYDRVLDLLPVGYISLDEMGCMLKINHAAADLLGGKRDQLIGSPFTSWLAEDARPQFLSNLRQVFASHGNLIVEVNSGAPNGALRDMRLVCKIMQCADAGKLLSCHMLIANLDEHRKADEIPSLTSSVISSTTDGIMIIDSYRIIRSINPAFEKITGYSANEAVGSTPSLIELNCHDKKFSVEMWEKLDKYGQWQGEVWNRHKNGEIYPAWLSISAVKNNQQRIIHYVGVLSSPPININIQKLFMERLQYLAYNDGLTGVPNRRLFLDRLNLSISKARRDNHMLAVLFVDLDQLKQINDTLGHKAGDELLVCMAERMKSCLRESDTLARFGGDEFTVILPAIHDADAASNVAKKFLDCCAQPMSINGKELNVTISIGISIFPKDGEGADDLISHADSAMYHVKNKGRNGYSLYAAEAGDTSALM